MSHFLGPIFEILGISAEAQLIWIVMALLAAFIIYSIRARSHGRVFAVIFVAMGFSLFFVLFSESPRVRRISVAVFAISCAAGFVWQALRRAIEQRRRRISP